METFHFNWAGLYGDEHKRDNLTSSSTHKRTLSDHELHLALLAMADIWHK